MKTQLIQLEPEDDHHSAREKIRWAKASRVVLIWPGRSRILTRQLDLLLLQRQAQHLGIQIGLISYDPDVLEIADQLGIPVFDSIESIDQQTWVRPVRRSPLESSRPLQEHSEIKSHPGNQIQSRTLPTWLRFLLFCIALATLAGTLLFSLPSARVTVNPPIDTLQISSPILVYDVTSAPQNSGFPAQSISVEVSGSVRVGTTGTTSAPDEKAIGILQLTNISTEQVSIPSGTRVRPLNGNGLAYEVTNAATIPPGGAVDVPIVAIEGGLAANIDSGSDWALEGDLGLVIQIRNEEPISGGTTAIRTAVSNADLIAASKILMDKLLSEASESIASSLDPDQLLIPSSLHALAILSSTQDHAVGDLAESLELSRTVEIEGMVLRKSELGHWLEASAKNDLGTHQTIVPGSLAILDISAKSAPLSGSIQVQVEFRVKAFSQFERGPLANGIRGTGRDDVERVIKQTNSEISLIEVQTRPAWMPMMPFFAFQIEIALPWETGI